MPDTPPAPPRRRKPAGGRPDKASAARLGAAILAAAEQEFFANGFSGARMEAIAEASGTSRQTLYARHGSKEALFIAVSSAILQDRFAAPPAAGASLRESMVHLADQMLDAILDPRLVRMYSMITWEAARFPELARMSDEDEAFPVRAMLEDLLRRARADGIVACDDPHEAMIMASSMIMAEPIRAAQLGLAFTAERQRAWARMAVDLFLNGVLVRRAGE